VPSDLETPPTPVDRGRVRVGAVIAALAIAVACVGVGGGLGTWQWQRAHAQAAPVEPDPRAPIADVMRPAEGGRGEGRLVEAAGVWSDAPIGLVTDKRVDDAEAVLLFMPLEVDAELTGTGDVATLPVLAGWLPPEEALAALPEPGGSAYVTGYVRGGEGTSLPPAEEPVDGVLWLSSMSTANVAQEWPSPVYSYLVVADEPAPGWNAMPPPPEEKRIDLQSATYALEWWVFGIFAAVLALRWIRDNGRTTPQEDNA
jgi:cytochrome oxidase assembly protein ShyY1